MNGGQVHRAGTFVFSLVMVAIGMALIVQVIAGHTSAIAPRMLLGVLFLAAGVGRAYVEIRRGRSG
jgi:hypothetical protein